MKKVAIVGVEGSGKTVMLAGLGDLYSVADENGFFLAPKDFHTVKYVTEKIVRMRKGEWPTATASDVMQGLDWILRQRRQDGQRPVDVCEVSCLDFAGEVYRYAFVRQDATPADLSDEVESLKSYIRDADDLIVLINLRDVIVHGEHDSRVQEAMWITNAILSYALDEQDGRNAPRAAIVLSQADSYADTIKACGGPKGVLAKYLPHVANSYDWLDILAASAVDKTTLDANGDVVPAPDFSSTNLRQIVRWFLGGDEGLSVGDGLVTGINAKAIELVVSRTASQLQCQDFFFPPSPKFQAKLRNMMSVAKKKCNREIHPDDAIALLDCTVFGSAKNGVLFARSGLYAFNDWTSNERSGFVSWREYAETGNVRKCGDSSEVHLCDSPIVGIDLTGSDLEPEQAVPFFIELQKTVGGTVG